MRTATKKHILSIAIFVILTAVCLVFFTRYVDVVIPEVNDETGEDTAVTEETKNGEAETDKIEDEQNNESEPQQNETVENDYILKETLDGGTNYLDKIIFLGDKNTYMMGRFTYTGIPDPMRQVWSVEQNITASQIMSVTNFVYPVTQEATNYLTAIKDRAPAFIVLSFGSYDNDEELTKERLISSLGDFIVNVKSVSPNTQIMVQSVLPVAENCAVISPAEVAERNEWLKELCSLFKVYYLDTYSSLCDENGILFSKYAANEGYFLNEEGYRQVIYYIRTHVHPNFSVSE